MPEPVRGRAWLLRIHRRSLPGPGRGGPLNHNLPPARWPPRSPRRATCVVTLLPGMRAAGYGSADKVWNVPAVVAPPGPRRFSQPKRSAHAVGPDVWQPPTRQICRGAFARLTQTRLGVADRDEAD